MPYTIELRAADGSLITRLRIETRAALEAERDVARLNLAPGLRGCGAAWVIVSRD